MVAIAYKFYLQCLKRCTNEKARIMDDELARLQGKLLDTSEKLENFVPTAYHATLLEGDLRELLGILNSLQTRTTLAA